MPPSRPEPRSLPPLRTRGGSPVTTTGLLGGAASSVLAAAAVVAVVLALLVAFGKSQSSLEAADQRPAAEQGAGQGVAGGDADEPSGAAADATGSPEPEAAAIPPAPAATRSPGDGQAADSDTAGAWIGDREVVGGLGTGRFDGTGAEDRDDTGADAASVDETSADEPSAREAAADRPAERAPVVVFNQTVRRGLAADFRDALVAAGWEVAATDDWRGTVPATTIYYPPGMQDAARALMSQFPAVERIRPAFPGIPTSQLTVILCKEFPEI